MSVHICNMIFHRLTSRNTPEEYNFNTSTYQAYAIITVFSRVICAPFFLFWPLKNRGV